VRAFVGLDVPPEEGEGPTAAPQHLTLRFLGEVDPGRVAAILASLEEVGRATPPFTLRLEGVGAFPTAASPRVVWVGVTVGITELQALAGRVRAALAHEGSAPPEEAFVAHLTLFRVRSARTAREARALLNGERSPPRPREVAVRELLLKESLLGPGGAIHRVLGTAPLTGGRPP
jgi:RNA 2',3'-cyclic 3'-phosphodiesterase